eukprot:TRINITY_DN743_c2_g1_i1.p1 TRINITY_DN743_c2_g1~~TRINITY_DN743_c2_g1_i1.p1  ORF type:complete len:1374 (+),score=494.59 TRINITY_DN743_c2_g1_i1:672-4793(+)
MGAIDQLAQSRELALYRVEIDQRLGRVLARAITAIDQRHIGGGGKLCHRTLFGMAHHDHIGVAADGATGIGDGLALGHGGIGEAGGIAHRATQAHEGRGKTQAGAGTGLEEQVGQDRPFQHAADLAPARNGLHGIGQGTQPFGRVPGELLDREQVAQATELPGLDLPCPAAGPAFLWAGLAGMGLQDLRDEAACHLRHGPEFTRFIGQQPGIQGALGAAYALRKTLAGHIETTQCVAQEDLLCDIHAQNDRQAHQLNQIIYALRIQITSNELIRAYIDLLPFHGPPIRQQGLYAGLGEALVDQPDRPAIGFGTDDAAGRLHHLLHAGVEIGVVVAGTEERIHAQAQLFVDRIDLRQSQRGHEGADEALARQIHTLAEGTTQHGKADALPTHRKAGQEGIAISLAHAARLLPDRNIGVRAREGVAHLLQVIEAGKEGQVIARPLPILARHQYTDRRHGRGTALPAGRDIGRHPHLQLAGQERRLHIDPGGVRRHAQQVGEIMPGRQRGREQRGGMGLGKARPQERRRHHVANRQHGIALVLAGEVQQRMRPEGIGQPHEGHGLEVEIAQRRLQRHRDLREVFADGADAGAQGLDQLGRDALQHLVGQQGLLGGGAPAAAQLLQRLGHHRRRHGTGRAQAGAMQLGAVHAAGARHQVVGLVGQHAHAPVVGLRHRIEHGAAIEPVVVVADNDIAPARHLAAQVVGADLVLQGDLAHGLAIQQRGIEAGGARGRQAIIETLRQRTGVAATQALRVGAGLVASAQFQHAQRQASVALEVGQGIQRQLPAGRLGGQEEDLVQPLRGRCLQRREQGTQGLADPGRGLGQQAAPAGLGTEDRLGQLPLPGPEIAIRKTQRLQCRIALTTMREFLRGPGHEAFALLREKRGQLIATAVLLEAGLLLAADIEIHQRQLDILQPLLLAQQMPIDAQLRPVQVAMIVGDAGQLAAIGLHLFQQGPRGVVAIGATAYLQGAMLTRQRHFALVGLAAPAGHDSVTGHTLLRGRRGREAQVEVALLGGELAQGPHRDGIACAIAHAASAVHCRQHTETGIAWRAQQASQRCWLSCRRSPGPLTSIMRQRRWSGQNWIRSGKPLRFSRTSSRIRRHHSFRCAAGMQSSAMTSSSRDTPSQATKEDCRPSLASQVARMTWRWLPSSRQARQCTNSCCRRAWKSALQRSAGPRWKGWKKAPGVAAKMASQHSRPNSAVASAFSTQKTGACVPCRCACTTVSTRCPVAGRTRSMRSTTGATSRDGGGCPSWRARRGATRSRCWRSASLSGARKASCSKTWAAPNLPCFSRTRTVLARAPGQRLAAQTAWACVQSWAFSKACPSWNIRRSKRLASQALSQPSAGTPASNTGRIAAAAWPSWQRSLQACRCRQ